MIYITNNWRLMTTRHWGNQNRHRKMIFLCWLFNYHTKLNVQFIFQNSRIHLAEIVTSFRDIGYHRTTNDIFGNIVFLLLFREKSGERSIFKSIRKTKKYTSGQYVEKGGKLWYDTHFLQLYKQLCI